MKQIAVISGKGGTGKTTVTASLVRLALNELDLHRPTVADCDVDAANLSLLLKHTLQTTNDFHSGFSFEIDTANCLACGKCQKVCRFEAVYQENDKFQIDNVKCEGCGFCLNICPAEAIRKQQNLAGKYYLSKIDPDIDFVHADLNIGEDNSGKLVSAVRREAKKLAQEKNSHLIIIDGPPGIGCPVNAAITGTDLALVVTEPTLSGIHDLERILDVTKVFKIKSLVVINKYDINLENSSKIADICEIRNIELAGKVPYSRDVVDELLNNNNIVDTKPQHPVSKEFTNIWRKIFAE